MAAVIFPWPAREERRARVEAARSRAEQARRKAEEARRVQHDLRRIVYEDNHIAQAIVDGLLRGSAPRHGHGGKA